MVGLQVSSLEAVKEVLGEWDVAETEKLLQKLEIENEKRKEEQKMRRDAETSKYDNSKLIDRVVSLDSFY